MRPTSLRFVWAVLTHARHVIPLTGVLSIPPSGSWDGADGLWSTFSIVVGTPGQVVRLLPGTSASACNSIWVVISAGCSEELNANVVNCVAERGGIYLSNESTTWSTEKISNNGLFQLPVSQESLLGLTGNAYFGFDTVDLGLKGQGLPTLAQQVIAGYATNSFWLGILGLSPIALNFTGYNDPVPSMLESLRSQGLIGSTSWSYTAGAPYKEPPVYGSLTLGGFDSTRVNASAQLDAIPLGTDSSRDLLIVISSITYDTLGSSPLLTESVFAFIDSTVSAMYLPLEVCRAFEQAFNLTWDSATSYYLLSSEQHLSLLAQNPTFTFAFSRSADGSDDLPISVQIPYAAFDLNITQPYVNSSTWYFPLKQAQNESEYTIGRVLLQELYVIANYDRRQFSVAQALFPPPPANAELQAIFPITTHDTALSRAKICGITLGGVAGVVLVGFATRYCAQRRRKGASGNGKAFGPTENASSEAASVVVIHSEVAAAENERYEIGTQSFIVPELATQNAAHHIGITQEIPSRYIAAAELEDMEKRQFSELPTG